MAHIPDDELDRLKSEISVQRLAEAAGIELKRHGADLIGLCPFHDDHEPSLVIPVILSSCRTVAAAVVGGTASRLGGGKFANGATTFGFLKLFGEVANYAGRQTDRLKQLACNFGGNDCVADERGVLRTDGGRDIDYTLNPEKSGNWLTRSGMGGEGLGSHIYENNTLVRNFIIDVSKIHDWFNSWNYSPSNGFYMSCGAGFDSAFKIYSFTGMPVAGSASPFAA